VTPLIPAPEARHRRFLDVRREQLKRQRRKGEQASLARYIRSIWGDSFILEEPHLLLCGYYEALFAGDIDRAMFFMMPRAGKSRLASIAGPSWYLGKRPSDLVMQVGHSQDLSVEFGRETKDLVRSQEYAEIFPGVELRADVKAAGRWHTNQRGGYFAVGVGTGIAGKGFNWGSADDLLSEQTYLSDATNKRILQWWGPGFYTRRQMDRSVISLTNTRWRKDDISGYLLQLARENKDADQYSVLKIPAIIDEVTAEMLNEMSYDPILREGPRKERFKFKAGDSCMPRRFPMKELRRIKANQTERAWQALYQQSPTQDEGAIIKRTWWRKWPEKKAPTCIYIIQMYDTAFEESEESDYSARTTWGIFEHTDYNGVVRPCVILLERWKARVGFPELRHLAVQAFEDFKPDKVLIEKKASGHSLIQELKRKKLPGGGSLPVQAVTIAKGASKTARAHAASVVPEQGCVFYMDRSWAQEVITECAEFPFGEHDDISDTCVHAWLYLRKHWWLQLADEPEDEEEKAEPVKPFG